MTAPPQKIAPGSIPRPCRHWTGRAGSCIRGDQCGSVMVNGFLSLTHIYDSGLIISRLTMYIVCYSATNTRHYARNFSLLMPTDTSILQHLTNRLSVHPRSQSRRRWPAAASTPKPCLQRNPKSPPRCDT